MTTLFISDLHLHEQRPDLTRAFLHCLDTRARRAETLYILGDLFDAWIGDDEDSPLSRQVIEALRQLTEEGVKGYICHGNRDFLLGEAFCRDSGLELLAEPCLIDLYGRPALIMHGDSLCTRDTDYLAFRQQVRQPAWRREFLSKPLEERRAIAAGLRRQSQQAQSNKAEDILDVTPAEVERVMAEQQVDCLIHGHTHRPAVHDLTVAGRPAQRFVLGDWDTLGWLLQVDRDGFDLQSFPIQ